MAKEKTKPKTFESFKEEFSAILLKRHLITINDCTDEDQLKSEFESGSTPEEFVEFIAEKHDLDRFDQPPFYS